MMKGRTMAALVMVGMVAAMTRTVMVTVVALLSVSEASRDADHLVMVTKSAVMTLMVAAIMVIKSVLVALDSNPIMTTIKVTVGFLVPWARRKMRETKGLEPED